MRTGYTPAAHSTSTPPQSAPAGWPSHGQDYGPYTYWRVYLRARFPGWLAGHPADNSPLGFFDPLFRHAPGLRSRRCAGAVHPRPAIGSISPAWQPPMAGSVCRRSVWRIAFSSTHYNKFALTEDLDWFSAMLQIYPRTALNTYTPVPSPTNTQPSPIRRPSRPPSPTPPGCHAHPPPPIPVGRHAHQPPLKHPSQAKPQVSHRPLIRISGPDAILP